MGSDLKTWVSDKLMSLLGYSQPTVVQYVISLSKKASSPAEIFGELKDMGVSSASETRAFSEEIFSKVERRTSGLNLYQQQEKEAAVLARRQRTYMILEADDDDDNDELSGSVSVASQSKKVDTRTKRFRKKNENHEDEDDEATASLEEERRVKQKTSRDEDDDSESDEERLRDQREREELERHLREKDAAGTRKLTEQKLSKKEEEEAIL